jgi:hypothetical protein
MVSQLIATLRRTLSEIEWAARLEGTESQIAELRQEFASAITELDRLKTKRDAEEHTKGPPLYRDYR